MKEIEANKKAWDLLAKDHYENFKEFLKTHETTLNDTIIKELGDIRGKSLIHLQCNTGADTVSLSRLGAKCAAVDFAHDNIIYGKKLADDFNFPINFIESDIMNLMENHHEKYDIVFTSEGVIGWLPDFKQWGKTVRALLKDDGFFYINEIHPFFLMFDEDKLPFNELVIKYPYFNKIPDSSDEIGGYATTPKHAKNYYWMFSVGEIINALAEAGLVVEFFHEFDTLCFDSGGMEKVGVSQFQYPFLKGKFPFQFSLKATVRK